MIAATCPAETDARENVSEFVSDPSKTSLGGLRTDGLDFLVDLVKAEIARQEPESRIVMLDRDFLSDNGVDFARDLRAVLRRMSSEGVRTNWIVVQDLPVTDWQTCLSELSGRDAQVYFFTTVCRQVPSCFKLINGRRRSGNSARTASSMSLNVAFSGTMSGGNPSSVSLSLVGLPIAAIFVARR